MVFTMKITFIHVRTKLFFTCTYLPDINDTVIGRVQRLAISANSFYNVSQPSVRKTRHFSAEDII